ncbi:MAG: 23S rRNA methyltransferase [Chloroflexi bacterium]|nr:23S rRNA methyltransferase [Chloroflexota bacterium]
MKKQITRLENDLKTIDTLREFDSEKEYADLILEKMGNFGAPLAKFEGEFIEVLNGIPGEKVRARIYRFYRKKKQITAGIVTEILEPSVDRVVAPCVYFGTCSGCQLQHVRYDKQLEFKRQRILGFLDDYDLIKNTHVLPAIPSPDIWNYRNHARFTVRFQGQLGFSNRVTRRFVRIDECKLMDGQINQVLIDLQDHVTETSNLSVRVGINTKQQLIQPKLNNSEISIETGQKWYQETLLDHNFRVASPSFFQVNTLQAEKMILLVSELLNLKPDEILVDAYAGVGVFASLLATKVRKVIAIEESQSAVDDYLQSDNSIDNLEFLLGKTENVLPLIDEDIDSVILDPPRLGCHPNVINSILIKKPTKLAYVSCDPESLARDLNLLVKGGYKIKNIQPIDMFPQTYHVESITILEIN